MHSEAVRLLRVSSSQTPVAAASDQPPPTRSVTITDSPDAASWDAFVQSHPEATGYHLWAWRDVFRQAFGHETIYLAATRGGVIVGILPIVVLDTWAFGRFGVSLPFVNYGGVVSSEEEAARALVEEASRIAAARRWKHLEIRHLDQRFPQLAPKRHKVAMYLPLAADETRLFEQIDRKVRNLVRKAQKNNFDTAQGGVERLGEFYEVFARNMRDLGTPVYAPSFFEAVLRAFPDRARLHLVLDKAAPVAASLTFAWRDMVEVPWASSLKEYRAQSPNMLLYWEMLRAAVADGHKTFDFGRSTPDEGTFQFKRQWGAEPRPMCWEYWLPAGQSLPDQSPKNSKFATAISLWQKLPLGVANAVGPHIVRGIP
jgi:FemAB-related protein (PEP-CTERM system-associated)